MYVAAGINKGAEIFLHLLKQLVQPEDSSRKVAFFHRNSSDDRKKAILEDLQLPLGSKNKKLICVVATVSLGKMRHFDNNMHFKLLL